MNQSTKKTLQMFRLQIFKKIFLKYNNFKKNLQYGVKQIKKLVPNIT